MNNIVKLIFSCISTGSGWADLKKNAAESLKNMNNLSGAVKAIGPSIGALGGVFGNALSAFLTGNIWAVAATGVKFLVDKLGLFKDKSAEAKEKLDKLEESTRKFYETINSNSQKSIEKIDAETKRRNEQLDITNRMIKAELQLQKAKAIASGDAGAAESIDRQMANADRTTAMDKAAVAERDAASKVKVAEKDARELERAAREAEKAYQKARHDLIESHWQDYRAAYKRAGGIASRKDFEKGFRFSEDDNKVIATYEKSARLAEEEVESAYARIYAEREKLKVARSNVKALKAEQEAADAETLAKKMSEGMAAERKRVADEVAAEKKSREDFAAQERERKEKERKERLQRELDDLKKETQKREEQRKKDLQKDIESNRKRADDLRQKLVDAEERAKKARDVLGNAASMDQAGGISEKRQEALTDDRYRDRRTALVLGDKVVRGGDGKWASAKGRLSNIEQATLDRMNADADVNKAKTERKEIVDRLDRLISKLDQAITI